MRYRGDTGAIQGRYRRDTGEAAHRLLHLEVLGEQVRALLLDPPLLQGGGGGGVRVIKGRGWGEREGWGRVNPASKSFRV